MSGLWSFRDNAPSSHCVGATTRAVLPASADEIVLQDALVESSSMLVGNAVRGFETVTDVGLVVEEMQVEWVEKTLGILKSSSYHLSNQCEKGSESMLNHPGEGCSSTATSLNLLDEEDMEVVRSLLKPRDDCGIKVRGATSKRNCGPIEPSSSVLRTAGTAPRRRDRPCAAEPREVDTVPVVRVQVARKSGTRPFVAAELLDYPLKPSWNNTRGSAQRLKERVPATRMPQRAAVGPANQIICDSTSFLIPGSNISLKQPKEVTSICRTRKKAPLYDALPLQTQVTLLSLEATRQSGWHRDFLDKFDTIARKWRSLHMRKFVWGRWCFRQGKRVGVPISVLVAVTDSSFLTPQRVGSFPLLAGHAMKAIDGPDARLLRWYFVMWVAAVQRVQEQRSSAGRFGPIHS
ncbi:uncharacterized protein TEOVI_000348400 [Trypanosoma equiperdum]|uniref:Uncharacterized protein n=2 Tax=Trypanozoon TaxID=39700 RepID=Q584T2_TRYB2|nr:hypothetical protein, conserved [Trypanosoma brucei brucei TREU927]AAX80857.1 hypothetical protein, conserved [Trypanosoma brucei]AAZ11786.1 hypothetical protein, conserved [Trypanosoma brucei brucei TREU927]SCU71902.1 hypothetical protein, conserved [Trypanosoma equiperdum]